MKRFLLKATSLLVTLSLLLTGVTNAWFFDIETSLANTMAAGSLDFSLTSPVDFSPASLNPGDSSSRDVSVINDGSLDFQYALQAVKTGGDDDFCNALELEAKLEGITQSSGDLLAFNFGLVIISVSQDDWQFIVSLNDDNPDLQDKTCQFNLIFWGEQIGGGGFTDEEILANTLASGDWTSPESYAVDDLEEYYSSDFEVNYEAQDVVGVVAQVDLYYSFNGGSWQLFDTDFPGASPVSDFFSVGLGSLGGDGEYGFLTIATDDSGNIENDADENGILAPDELNGLLPDTWTVVDTSPPVTMLSVDPYLAVANEQLYNGGFENGDLAGWTVESTGSEHQATTEDSQTGSYSALIGFKNSYPLVEPAYDAIKQDITLPLATSTLSFWYRLMTDDWVSSGFFEALVTPAGLDPILVAHDGWDDPALMTDDLDWQNVTYQLTGLEGEAVEIQFKVTQPDDSYLTWAYLDDVKVCAAENLLDDDNKLSLRSHDGGGSDNETTYYSIDGAPEEEYVAPVELDAGTHTITYYSEDEAGNVETEKEIEIIVQEDPVDFGVVLNEILPNPAGEDDDPMPGGEWVKLYNNSAAGVDVNGWELKDALGGSVTISSSNSDNNGNTSDGGETIVPAGSTLTVYRDEDADFIIDDATETIELYNGATLVDSYSYDFDTDLADDKSLKRDPDGTGGWKDPLVEEPEAEETEEEVEVEEEAVVNEEVEEVEEVGEPAESVEEQKEAVEEVGEVQEVKPEEEEKNEEPQEIISAETPGEIEEIEEEVEVEETEETEEIDEEI